MPLLEVTNGPTPPTGQTLTSSTKLVVTYDRPYSDDVDVYPQVFRADYDVTNGTWKPEGAVDGTAFYVAGAGVGDPVPPGVKIVERQVYADASSVDSYRRLSGVYEDTGVAGTWDYARVATGYAVVVNSDVADTDATTILSKLSTVDGAGSGLDADLLDGLDSAAFVAKAGDTMTGNLALPDGGTLGSTTTPGAITIASNGDIATGGIAPVALGGRTGVLTVYGSNATGLVFKDAAGEMRVLYDDSSLTFAPAGTGAFSIDAATNVNVLTGNLKFGTSGKGIDFSATSDAAGMTSELLDDYEEGTWTPTFTNLSLGNGTVSAKYTKVGDVVYIGFVLVFGSTTSISGNVSMTGRPYTSPATYETLAPMILLDSGAGFRRGFARLNAGGTTTTLLIPNPSTAALDALNSTNPFTWATGDEVRFTASYQV